MVITLFVGADLLVRVLGTYMPMATGLDACVYVLVCVSKYHGTVHQNYVTKFSPPIMTLPSDEIGIRHVRSSIAKSNSSLRRYV